MTPAPAGRCPNEYNHRTQEEKIQALADLLQKQQRERIAARYSQEQADTEAAQVVHGKAYAKVNVGPVHNMGGKLMVDYQTGVIYGIKGYGQVHKGNRYGTLDTIGQWYWGEYYPRPYSALELKFINGLAKVPDVLKRARRAMFTDNWDDEHATLAELVELVTPLVS